MKLTPEEQKLLTAHKDAAARREIVVKSYKAGETTAEAVRVAEQLFAETRQAAQAVYVRIAAAPAVEKPTTKHPRQSET
jgi:hypothetical protein